MLLLLLACNDYDLVEKPEDPLPGDSAAKYPDVAWLPESVDAGIVCGDAEETLEIRNEGEADLTILGLSATGWTLGAYSIPAVVPSGEIFEVQVMGVGTGEVEVLTDDPDEPEFTIPLQATPDAPPSLLILSPYDGQVLDVAPATTFQASVADDADAPDSLTATWTSDVDGLLASELFTPDGTHEYLWDAAVHTPGSHTLTVETQDSCGNTASQTLTVCQQLGYDVDSLDLANWHFEGTARWDSTNSYVELTGPYENQGGTAFQTASAVPADNVVIDFNFYVSGGSGADGISLTALDTNRMTGFVGSSGGGIGYGGLPGWSIEVDTYYNGDNNDPTPEDHLSLHFDGNIASPQAWAALPEMEDGQWHHMVVSVVAPHVTVEIDNHIYIDQDVPGNYNFPAYVGFTAATGSLTNYHLIDSLVVTEYVCGD